MLVFFFKIHKNPRHCNGVGLIKVDKNIEIKIPQNIENRQNLRILENGHVSCGKNSTPGDLLINIRIKQNKKYEKCGLNIIHSEEISEFQAKNGCELLIKTLQNENINIKIPKNTKNDDHIILKNKVFFFNRLLKKGLSFNKNIGDFIIKIIVQDQSSRNFKLSNIFKNFRTKIKTIFQIN